MRARSRKASPARHRHGGQMRLGAWTERELVVDLFAGGGGASEGIARALGRHPDIAVNHDPAARPFDLAWARSTIAQCRDAGVPVFMKQLGALPHVGGACAGWATSTGERGRHWRMDDTATYPLSVYEIRDRKGGDPAEWPEDLRVREWPGVQP